MKTSPISFLVLCLLIISSCQKEELSDFTEDSGSDISTEDLNIGICTQLYGEDLSRAFGPKNLVWNKNVLRVRFLGGTSFVQNKIKQHAATWSNYANMEFQFVDAEPSDIRISFDEEDGSWSYIGRTNSYIPSYRATMNFGWFNNQTSDREFRRTTLHEFGHALGLAHEHQHPLVDINWNKEAVYEYYATTQDWSRSDVDNNIFDTYSTTTTNYTTYDPQSIMHYYIPKSLVLGTWNPTFNTTLSALDIQFIGKMYPKTNVTTEIEETCQCPDDAPILACDDFESYDQSTYENAANWSRWASTSGYAELQTYTWGKVIKVQYAATKNPDILYTPALSDESHFNINWDMYVGSGNSAYFNIQKSPIPGQEFGAQFYLDTDKTGRIEINNQTAEFNYGQNQWNKFSLDIDLANNISTLLINDQSIASWPSSWSTQSANGSVKFAAINFYAIDANARFWLDDFCVSSRSTSTATAADNTIWYDSNVESGK